MQPPIDHPDMEYQPVHEEASPRYNDFPPAPPPPPSAAAPAVPADNRKRTYLEFDGHPGGGGEQGRIINEMASEIDRLRMDMDFLQHQNADLEKRFESLQSEVAGKLGR